MGLAYRLYSKPSILVYIYRPWSVGTFFGYGRCVEEDLPLEAKDLDPSFLPSTRRIAGLESLRTAAARHNSRWSVAYRADPWSAGIKKE